jgi:hypothetical protein
LLDDFLGVAARVVDVGPGTAVAPRHVVLAEAFELGEDILATQALVGDSHCFLLLFSRGNQVEASIMHRDQARIVKVSSD